MKLILINLILIVFSNILNAQCLTKTTERPDGSTVKYFNPKPVVKHAEYEVGLSIYKNKTTNEFFLNVSVLFKTLIPKELTGNTIIQTTNSKGISLALSVSELIVMNSRNVAIGLYKIEQNDYNELKGYNLKSIYFYLNNDLKGSTVTENYSLLRNQLECF